MAEMIIYELHVGTFTSEGTLAAVIDKLDYLRDLGVNTIEIMPVAQFPGRAQLGLRRGVPLRRPALVRGGTWPDATG